MIFRQLFDSVSGTYTYLLASRRGGEALIIDPVIEKVERYIQLIAELDLKLVKANIVLVIHNRQLSKVKIRVRGLWKRQAIDAQPGQAADPDYLATAIRLAVQPSESLCPTKFGRWKFKIAHRELKRTRVKIELREHEEHNDYALVWPCPQILAASSSLAKAGRKVWPP